MIISVHTPNEKQTVTFDTGNRTFIQENGACEAYFAAPVEDRSLIYVQKKKDYDNTITTLLNMGYTDISQ